MAMDEAWFTWSVCPSGAYKMEQAYSRSSILLSLLIKAACVACKPVMSLYYRKKLWLTIKNPSNLYA